jgi:hypothetical protein
MLLRQPAPQGGVGALAARKPAKRWEKKMNAEQFRASLAEEGPRADLPAPLAALWWDAKGDWAQAHGLVDELETVDGMAVHAYLHRKEGSASNADYWYQRAGRNFLRPALDAEWTALVGGLLSRAGNA